MIHVLARITVRPEFADAARGIMTALVAQTRLEPGCLGYELFHRSDAPHEFRTVERWVDQASVDGHMKSAHVSAAIAAAGPMFATPPEILSFVQLM
jgi:quinol monooxygenase YgiN